VPSLIVQNVLFVMHTGRDGQFDELPLAGVCQTIVTFAVAPAPTEISLQTNSVAVSCPGQLAYCKIAGPPVVAGMGLWNCTCVKLLDCSFGSVAVYATFCP
jgi:hypothetical protein